MTKLDAINYMLISVGEPPVNSLETETIDELSIAIQVLDSVTREVNSQGWNYNREYNFKLYPDVDKYIYITDSMLQVDAEDPSVKTVMRAGKLYDKANHTFIWDVDSLSCTITWDYIFDDLPPVVQEYVKVRAVRIYQTKILGDPQLYQYNIQDELDAKVQIQVFETEQQDVNMFDNLEYNEYRRY